MKWHRSLRALGLTLLLLAGVSCSTDDGPFGVSEEQPVEQPVEQPAYLLGDLLGVVGGTVGGVLDLTGQVLTTVINITGLLVCQEQQYAVTYQTVGSQGGTIRVGKHSLTIPRGALRQNVRIKAEQLSGSTNSVRFSPEGLEFSKPAVLALNYQNCENADVPKTVVYTSEKLVILEVLRSLDLFKARTIAAPIDHFSRYAVAY